MANQGRSVVNPFDANGPSDYEQWLYAMGTAHGQLIIELSQQIELVKRMLQEHMEHHTAANKAALDMPDIVKSEKPN